MRPSTLILEEWLGDFPLGGQADRANLLALILTPFVRGLVPLVPLAVLDGLQMGVGKNLLADCLALVVTGQTARPLPFPRDDVELGKVITSTFGTGAELFVFDEAHVLQGRSLARALTAITWEDRILGFSRMAQYPNRITWMSLGNNVQVVGDLARRVYRIAIHPTDPNPENRPVTSYRHPDLRAWTLENRHRLIEAVLILVRAWFTAGQPMNSRGVQFGSFEGWNRIVGGILHVAGIDGFLDNIRDWRGESDFETAYWTAHLEDLHNQFGPGHFKISRVVAALQSTQPIEPPPGLEDPNGSGYSRELGKAYSRVRGRWFGRFHLTRVGKPGAGGGQGSVNKWQLQTRDDDPRGSDTGPRDHRASTRPREGSEGPEGSEGSHNPLSRDLSPSCSVSSRPASLVAEAPAPGSRDPSDPSHPSRAAIRGALAVRVQAVETERITKLARVMSRTGLRVDTDLLHRRLDVQAARQQELVATLVAQLSLPAKAATSPRPWTTTSGLEAMRRVAGDDWPSRPDGQPRLTLESLRAGATGSDAFLASVCGTIEELMQLSPFPTALRKYLVGDRVHPVYGTDTVTGRWSSKDPNILGVGQRKERLLRDRDLILAEPGEVFVGVDLSGIDARCVAGLSGDPAYAELFQPGVDIHGEMSQLFFGDREHRGNAKAITHGIN